MKNNFRINLNFCYISFLPENPEHYTLILTLEADSATRLWPTVEEDEVLRVSSNARYP